MLLLEVFGWAPNHPRQVPFAKVSFRPADSPYTRRDTRLQGFLHYHVPLPSRPFSGGLRFRCTPSLASFAEGGDLLCPSGLPWTVPLPNLMGLRGQPIIQSLLRDNLVRLTDFFACKASFHKYLDPDMTVVHGVGQPWLLDLRNPAMIYVPGPRSLLRCRIYPAVARYGSAIVRFEYTGNPDYPHELAVRVLELRSNVSFHPSYAHLPPLVPDSLLAHPMHDPAHVWTWNHEMTQKEEMAAGLYCLINGPCTSPHVTQRVRAKMSGEFYHELPTDEELKRYGEPE
ncbi:hypothetical protein C8R44DRAFT_877653 [Mycena epipterygia]|nr:hypothetical protein C8R44DRAFT_877653 [Mycena epipterygia]